MDQQPFSIVIDPLRGQITISFDPVFWTTDIADRFLAECHQAVTSLGCAPGEHVILADLHNAVLQSQEVYDRMRGLTGSATARRIALVAATPLARMQTKRLQIGERVVMFADRADAQRWLDLDDAARAA